jgi:hypothetical protein
MDFRTSRRREAAAGCALPPPHPRKDTIMELITTQGVAIPRLGFGTFRMPGGDAQPVVESAIALGYPRETRPIWHQREDRVQAHILVRFLAFVLWKSLEVWQQRAGLGKTRATRLAKEDSDAF